MSREDSELRRAGASRFDARHDQTVSILAVGNATEWRQQGKRLQGDEHVAFASFEDIDAELLSRLCPTVILSPVLAQSFDCIDLAQRLHALGYTGRYRAVSDGLPDPEMVEREIRQMCRGLDFSILIGQ